jgi:hypothetical protein
MPPTSNESRTCSICGALITADRGGEPIRLSGHDQPAWVHPECRGQQLQGAERSTKMSRAEMLRALQRVQRIREEFRSGKRERRNLPELTKGSDIGAVVDSLGFGDDGSALHVANR